MTGCSYSSECYICDMENHSEGSRGGRKIFRKALQCSRQETRVAWNREA